jgi:hypothetical protein
LFEASETTCQVLAKNPIELLDQYEIRNKIIAYHVKDACTNLNVMTSTLKYVVNCELLSLEESFKGTCFGHAFFKACQYGTTK